jgi:hypothetical protein
MNYLQRHAPPSLRVELEGDHVLVRRFELELWPVDGFPVLPICTLPSTTPLWFQRRLAVLLTLDYDPPNPYVANVGRRIDATTFWIYYDPD